ncbi:MAG: hypothetical protein HWN65_24090 [Candidatus Helarchaeota archaeon]|nr:hypothetical protein [Candidatus Helarchaeota archaeon]
MRMSKYGAVIIALLVFMWGIVAVHHIPLFDHDSTPDAKYLSVTYEWETLIGDEHIIGQDLVMDKSHNIYVVGNMLNSSENSYDVIVIKYNALGTIVWNVTWGGILDDYAYALAINTTSSRLYVTGRTASYGIGGSNDIFIVSYDASGTLQKNITWGGDKWDVGFDITCTSEFVYVIGYSDSFSSSQDMAVLKYNSSYSLMWNNTYGTSESDIGYGISIDSSDNVVITGKITSSSDTNAIVMKLDSGGNQLWNTTWGGSSSDEGRSVVLDDISGEIFMLGNTRSFGSGSTDMTLLKFNSTGGFQWQRTWGGTDIDTGYTLLYDSHFNMVFIGYTESFGSVGKDACIVKYISSGEYQWHKTRTDASEDVAYGGYIDENDNIYITGKSGTRLFLTKFNPLPDAFLLSHDATTPDIDGTYTVPWTESLGADNYTLYQSNSPITAINSSVEKVVEGNTNRTIVFTSVTQGIYYYRVVAYNEYGNITSNLINITVQYPPGTFFLSHDADVPDKDGTVNFTWSPSQGADRYELYMNNSLYKDNITDTSYVVHNLDTNDYAVSVRAINDAGQRSSNEVVISIRRAPASFLLTTDASVPDTDGSFDLTWTKSFYAQYYVLYNSSTFISQINISVSVLLNFTPLLDLPTYRYSLDGLHNGTYYYQIIAFNAYGNFTTECIHIPVSIPPPPPLGQLETTQFPYEIVMQVIVLFSLLGVLVFIYARRKK